MSSEHIYIHLSQQRSTCQVSGFQTTTTKLHKAHSITSGRGKFLSLSVFIKHHFLLALLINSLKFTKICFKMLKLLKFKFCLFFFYFIYLTRDFFSLEKFFPFYSTILGSKICYRNQELESPTPIR